MGQQQLLLIILALIIVGLAIVVGLWLVADTAAAANRDAVYQDLQNLTGLARKHYRTPILLGGGGNTFDNFTLPPTLAKNANGTYIRTSPGHSTDHIHFDGIGVEKGIDGVNPIQIEVRIEIDEVKTTEKN